MADHSTPTPEAAKASPIPQPPIQDVQRTNEAEVEQTSTLEQRMARAIGGASPQTPPEQFAGAMGHLGGSSQAGMLRQLQRSYGNSFVGKVIQAKLRVSQPGDVYEQEADRVSEKIVNSGADTSAIASKVGIDINQIHLHTHSAAAKAAHALDARAFTVGEHIVFGEGEYAPQTQTGKKLLAHELVHVAQQKAGKTELIQRQPLSSTPNTSTPTVPSIDAISAVPTVVEQTVEPVTIHFKPYHPWLFTVEGNPSPAAISRELYGVDLSAFQEKEKVFTVEKFKLVQEDQYRVYPELLREPYRTQFHQAMEKLLEQDVKAVENLLLETRIDSEDEAKLIEYVSWWSQRRDLRTTSGQTYFDAFLARLKNDKWYTDYGLWESSRKPFLDKLYEEVEERAGKLNTLIAQNSREFGGYRPVWATLEGKNQIGQTTVNQDLVNRTADIILDRLKGWTSNTESGTIADTLVGLPPPEQAAVLKKIMSRYDETDWTGIFGRFGEAWEGGMLYYLFEDLSEEDRSRVANSLKASKVIEPQAVDALVAGRGWGGKYLPYTTYKAHKASEYLADVAVHSEGLKSIGAQALLFVTVLWTPEIAGHTVLTLTTARAGPVLGGAFPTLGKGMLVVGTGLTAYGTTIAVGELLTGKNVYNGEPLNQEDKIVRVLQVTSNLLLLGAGFLQARAMTPASSGGQLANVPSKGIAPEPPLTGGTTGGMSASQVQFRVVHVEPTTGEYTVVGHNLQTGELAVIRINANTGNGIATNMTTGESLPIAGFKLQAPPRALLPTGSTLTPETSVMPSTTSTGLPSPQLPGTGEPLALPPGVGIIESAGAAVSASRYYYDPFTDQTYAISATARTSRSIVTSIWADRGEVLAYQTALARGEIGLQRPLGSNVPGPDFITAMRNPQTGALEVIVNDAKTSLQGNFPTPKANPPSTWLNEAQQAVAPGRLNLNNPTLEAEIQQAVQQGRVRLRQLNVDFSLDGRGTITGW